MARHNVARRLTLRSLPWRSQVWLSTAAPSIALLSLIRSEPLAPPAPTELPPEGLEGVDGGSASCRSVVQGLGQQQATRAVAKGEAMEALGMDLSSDMTAKIERDLGQKAEVEGEIPRVRLGIAGIFASFRRLRAHRHASRFVVAQTLYLTAATADGTSASLFAQARTSVSLPCFAPSHPLLLLAAPSTLTSHFHACAYRRW